MENPVTDLDMIHLKRFYLFYCKFMLKYWHKKVYLCYTFDSDLWLNLLGGYGPCVDVVMVLLTNSSEKTSTIFFHLFNDKSFLFTKCFLKPVLLLQHKDRKRWYLTSLKYKTHFVKHIKQNYPVQFNAFNQTWLINLHLILKLKKVTPHSSYSKSNSI